MTASPVEAEPLAEVLRLESPKHYHRPLPTLSLTVCPDGRHVLTSGLDLRLRMWDLKIGMSAHTWDAGGPISSIVVGPEGTWALLGAIRGVVWWDLETWSPRGEAFMWSRKGRITAVDYAEETGTVLAASEDLVIYRWILSAEKALEPLRGHQQTPSALGVDRGGKVAVSGDTAGQLRLWDLPTGACLKAWQGHDDTISDLVLMPDERRVLSAGHDRELHLWDLRSGECVRTFAGCPTWITGVAVDGEGSVAVAAGSDGIHLWDIASGRCVGRIEEPRLTAFAITPDGEHVVASSTCNALSVWPLRRVLED